MSDSTKIIHNGQLISDSNPLPIKGGLSENVLIQLGDSSSIDAFGRLRVSNPETIFDSKNIFNDDGLATNVENQPLIYDNAQTSGSGTSTEYKPNEAATHLNVSAATAGTRVRQSKIRFNYQPGKSLLVFMSYVFGEQATGITKREGVFDESNGLFLEDNGTNYGFVRRTNVTGTPVDNRTAQSSWNIDKMDGTGISKITLDFTKTQILAMDYEWLGVGRVRMGFVVDGLIYYAHEINNANKLDVVYMSTPNLPLRSEISNDGTGKASSIVQICSTVVSEGGQNPLGQVRRASTNGTHVDCNVENTIYAILGIRLKSNYIGETVDILSAAIQLQTGNHQVEYIIKYNPTVAGTFAYVGETNSGVEIARGALANTVTGGIDIGGGFAESGGQQAGNSGSDDSNISNALKLGSNINGTVDTIVLCARPIGGSTNVDVEGSITWRELN
jgi:hypothetical protein